MNRGQIENREFKRKKENSYIKDARKSKVYGQKGTLARDCHNVSYIFFTWRSNKHGAYFINLIIWSLK